MADQNEAHRASLIEAKRELRQRMRTMRRELADRPERSARIVERLVSLDVVIGASRLLAYDSIVGEVETAGLIAWCAERGIRTAMPEDAVDASWPDVIIVPGTAFTIDGARIGQGGGWYDRFLPGRTDQAVLIGLAFAPQIVESLPTEPHDVALDMIVTEDAVHVAADSCR
jgi:5-formyltetrahydrofolate cyclo-ligase